MSGTKCIVCKAEIEKGEFISVPGGGVHKECFACPVCGENLVGKKGYLPFKGNFLCGIKCRTAATRDPDLLLQNTEHWRETRRNKSGWQRPDGAGGYDGGLDVPDKIQPTLASEAAKQAQG